MPKSDLLLRSDLEGGITRLTLNRAPVNALSAELLMAYAATLDGLAQDDAVRAVVVDSAFKVFSAGLDLKEAQDFDRAQQNAIVDGLNIGFLTQFAFPKPLVAAVGGAAIAGGLFFVLAADYRVATARAQFGLAEVRVGADFPIGPLEIARATLDADMMRRLMLTGIPVDSATALARGVVDEIAEPENLGPRAVAAARQMADSPPGTFAAVKKQIRGATIASIETAMDDLARNGGRGWFSDETRAAMQRMIG